MSFWINWFLPHHGNNHKAHLIKSYSLFGLSFIFVFCQLVLSHLLITNPEVLGFSANISPERIVELTNQQRSRLNLNSLRINNLLSEAARQKAGDMFAFNYWAHVSPSGRTPWSFFSDVGYKYQYAGENLARDFRDPESVVSAWMNSPTHRDNIVNPKYQEIGVAVVDGSLEGVETTLVVQLFGTTYAGVPAKPVDKTSVPAQKPVEVNQPVPAEESQPLVEVEIVPTTEPVTETLPLMAEIQNELVFTNKAVLAKKTGFETPYVNPLDLTKALTIFIVGILIGVFAADLLLVSHRQTPRFSSRSFAQMMFLFFVLGVSILVRQGAVL